LSIDDLKQDIEGLSRLYVKSKGLDFSCTIDAALPEQMIGDRFRLRQILTNLIGNAVKFTKNGQISVSVELEALYADNQEALIRFKVKDTGIGIPLDRQVILFKPFSQADTSTTREFGGTGLGLAISKNLVELMNGTITLESAVGEGSTFTFTCKVGYVDLKAINSDSDVSIKSESDGLKGWMHQMLSKQIGILLAEDSKENYEYIERIARKSNWNMFHAKNGKQAIELFVENREKIDIILMDLEMPTLDGYEATKQIRALERNEAETQVRIIAISANVLAGEREKCLEIGMDDYLTKPFRIEQLLAHLESK